jgi:hypothetical protein
MNAYFPIINDRVNRYREPYDRGLNSVDPDISKVGRGMNVADEAYKHLRLSSREPGSTTNGKVDANSSI